MAEPRYVRPPVRGARLHHRAPGHRPGHPPLPRLRADQRHRPQDGRADRRPLWSGHAPRPGGGVGVSTSLGVRIYKTYGDEAVRIVTEEPYRLALDIWGIGFKTADKIAQNLGIAYDSAERVKAGLRHTLSEASEAGHCHLPQTELIAKASEVLGVRPALAEACLEELVRERGVIRDQVPIPAFDDNVPAIYLVPFHRAEVSLSAGLLRVLHAPEQTDRLPWFRTVDWTVALEWLHRSTGHRLTHEQ